MQNEMLPLNADTPVFSLPGDATDRKVFYISQEQPAVAISYYRSLPLHNVFNRYFKRFTDIAIALAALLILMPVLLPIIALLIKISSKGPVFFLQKRTMKGGKLFTCIKFRTMVVNNHADMLPARENDDRITKTGRFLRNYYLDELPQLINVLMGHMSIIGPRPHMIADDERFASTIPVYYQRQQVKPGITGLAQVMGYTGIAESEEQMKNRLLMDMHYINNWNILMDCRVLFLTLIRVFRF